MEERVKERRLLYANAKFIILNGKIDRLDVWFKVIVVVFVFK